MNTRNARYFPQLEGLKARIDQAIATAPRSTAINAATNLQRDDDDIQARLDKQAAKLARRAKHARSAGLL